MLKPSVVLLVFLLISSIALAQQSTNPFKDVKFLHSPTDTVTVSAIYNGVLDSVDY